MINIITSFYISHFNSNLNTERNNELQECLNKNLKNDLIEKIHLYIDDNESLEYILSLNNDKINIISVGYKPLYSDLFSYALTNLQNKICMITNSDIFILECDKSILNYLDDSNTVFALTRYEYDLSSPLIDNYQGSHDCFIFKSLVNFINNLENIKHVQHVWGSENVVLYELAKSNIKIYNPCYQIKIIHLHKSDLREGNRPRINHDRSHIVKPCKL
jgi:hypothetical protein